MLTNELYNKLLIEPLKENSQLDRLLIVSGYATSAMGFHFLNEARELKKQINLELIVGMTPKDGLSLSNHNGFKKLVTEDFLDNFKCSYVAYSPPVHSKLYVWCKKDTPMLAFAGSANYTQTALRLKTQKEVMVECDHKQGFNYFNSLISSTVYCENPEAEQAIVIYKDNRYFHKYREIEEESIDAKKVSEYSGLEKVTISFLDRDGNLPQRSGLNWGQRPEANREPNQAYIRLTSNIYKTDFFPPKTIHFTVLTDDGKTLVCSRAQENGKAIHTPHNNSLIGEYFRNRLSVSNGEPVLRSHLEQYGRSDLSFFKIDDETYYIDFSP